MADLPGSAVAAACVEEDGRLVAVTGLEIFGHRLDLDTAERLAVYLTETVTLSRQVNDPTAAARDATAAMFRAWRERHGI